MDYKFWIPVLLTAIGMGLNYWQIYMKRVEAEKKDVTQRMPWYRLYWPIGVMVILVGLGWLPYLWAPPCKPKAFQRVLLQWAGGPNGEVATILSTVGLQDDRGNKKLMLVVRIVDPTIDEMLDTRIEKSAMFDISKEPTMQINVVPGESYRSRLKVGATVAVYVLEVPADFRPDRLGSLSELEHLNGAIVDTGGFGIGASSQPPTQSPPKVTNN